MRVAQGPGGWIYCQVPEVGKQGIIQDSSTLQYFRTPNSLELALLQFWLEYRFPFKTASLYIKSQHQIQNH